jgi:hypothetical protein
MSLPFGSCAFGLLGCPYAGRQSLSLLLQRKQPKKAADPPDVGECGHT